MAEQANAQNNAQNGEFLIQKIYLEDVSVESPNTPSIFQESYKPEANIELNTANEKLPTPNAYKVALTLTVTTKTQGKTVFLIQLKQVGIFTVANFPEAQMAHILGSFCPSVLFPYARETLSSLVTRAGFPDLQLAPINFDALYAQSLQAQAQTTSQPTKETVQ